MSKENIKLMFVSMGKDEKLQKKFEKLAKENQKDPENVMAGKIVEFGKAAGFVFSKEELLEARLELVNESNDNKELADDELANVAGGGEEMSAKIEWGALHFEYQRGIWNPVNGKYKNPV